MPLSVNIAWSPQRRFLGDNADRIVYTIFNPRFCVITIYSSYCGSNDVIYLEAVDIAMISYKPSENLNCQWTVLVPKGKTIIVVVEYSNMVGDCPQRYCVVDSLAIYDKDDVERDRLAFICGDDSKPSKVVYSGHNQILVEVTKHEVYLRNTFQIVFIPTDILQCPFSIGHDDNGLTDITEENGPVTYIDRVLKLPCLGKIKRWHFHLPFIDNTTILHPGIYRRKQGKRFVLIGQNDLSMTNGMNGSVIEVPVKERLSFQPGDFIGLYCPGKCFIQKERGCADCEQCSSDNILTIDGFQKERVIPMEAIKGSYRLPITVTLEKYCNSDKCSGCGSPSQLTDDEGSFHTTNFATGATYFYPNILCTWTIIVTTGNFIHLSFDTFDIPRMATISGLQCLSYVALYNAPTSNEQDLMNTFCGSEVPLISSVSNKVTIEFSSDDATIGRGFVANYYSAECPGYGVGFTEQEANYECLTECGYFQSIGYPHPNPSDSVGRWTILVAEDKVINLVFMDFNVGNALDPGCINNYVKVYNSETPVEAFLYGTFCRDKSPGNIISGSSKVHIEFRGRNIGDGVGFLAQYFAVPYEMTIQLNQTYDPNYRCQKTEWQRYGNNCYKFYRQKNGLKWSEAEKHCVDENSHLISILNKEESIFVTFALARLWWYGETVTYIGLTDQDKEGDYRWTDSNPMSYSDWAISETADEFNQPDGSTFEQCTAIQLTNVHNSNHWHDITCALNRVRQFICKQPAMYVGESPQRIYDGISTYKCEDQSWRLYEDNCFKPVTISSAETVCENLGNSFPDPSSEKELDTLKYYSSHVWLLQEYIAVQWQMNSTHDTLASVDDITGSGMGDLSSSSSIGGKKPVACDSATYQCGNGVCIHDVYVCDGTDDCSDGSDEMGCDINTACPVNAFQCSNGKCISMSFYCDFINQCGDNSDEETCVYRNCTATEFTCNNGQCIDNQQKCDLVEDCFDSSDELSCDSCRGFQCYYGDCLPSRTQCDGEKDCVGNEREDEIGCDVIDSIGQCQLAELECANGHCIDRQLMCIYDVDKYGYEVGCRDVTHLRNCELFTCPVAMFKCPNSYCIPLHRRCDNVKDCPDGYDEQHCESYSCPGDFQCHATKTCVSLSELCDGIKQCQYGDDELLCDTKCPPGCLCHGLTFECVGLQMAALPQRLHKDARKLVFTGNNLTMSDVDFHDFKMLAELDLSNNSITEIQPMKFYPLVNLYLLNLNSNAITYLNDYTFIGLVQLKELHLSQNGISKITDEAFQGLRSVQLLSLVGNLFDVDNDVLFRPMVQLQYMYTDSYKYCCMVTKYQSVEICTPGVDVFSSCEDLMANKVLRAFVWILGLLALVGNIFVVAWRIKENDLKKVPSLLVWNLAIADFFMGLYMLIIASADMFYRGVYVRFDEVWRKSILCSLAGFLAMLSSEVSVFTLTLITLDRFFAIVFPLKFIRLKRRHAVSAVICGWVTVAVVSFLPLSGIEYFGDSFYGRSPVCLSLHLTNEKTPGWEFSVSISLFLNFLSFLIIFACYTAMYVAIRRAQNSGMRSTKKSNEAADIAKRMTLIVLTDFCCWVPITVMGMLALTNTVTIPGDVYAWTAVFILPVNSAANPILYTISVINTKSTIQTDQKNTSDKATDQTVILVSETMPSSHFIPPPTFNYIPLSTHLGSTTLKVNDVYVIATGIATALDFLHTKDIVHGFVRLDTILVTIDDRGSVAEAFLSDASHSKYAERRNDNNGERKLQCGKDIFALGRLIAKLLDSCIQDE
ncbi:uncharacterized protein LOC144437958 [Glandiceps talaboti]